MPKYDYMCLETDNIFEVEQRMTDDPLERCICCKEKYLVKRLPSLPKLVINAKSSMTDRKLYKELDID
jgi:putative FmdB family regulatory protein|tara:strand:- start:266 stop:469 length:204 start_codon:yes stop_codon:yes gene_type:complete